MSFIARKNCVIKNVCYVQKWVSDIDLNEKAAFFDRKTRRFSMFKKKNFKQSETAEIILLGLIFSEFQQ